MGERKKKRLDRCYIGREHRVGARLFRAMGGSCSLCYCPCCMKKCDHPTHEPPKLPKEPTDV